MQDFASSSEAAQVEIDSHLTDRIKLRRIDNIEAAEKKTFSRVMDAFKGAAL